MWVTPESKIATTDRGSTVGAPLRAPVLKTAVLGGWGWLLRGLLVLRARAHAVTPLRYDLGSVVIPNGWCA